MKKEISCVFLDVSIKNRNVGDFEELEIISFCMSYTRYNIPFKFLNTIYTLGSRTSVNKKIIHILKCDFETLYINNTAI